jgi:hypothetical protein
MYDLTPYVDRCALIYLETLTRRRSDAYVMFFSTFYSVRLAHRTCSLVNVIGLRCHTRSGNFLRIDFHGTSYSVHESFGFLMRLLVCSIFICQGINFLIV